MERLQQLISKLNDQCEQNETALQMLITLKQIEAELSQLYTITSTARKNPAVSVVMPSMNISHRAVEEYIQQSKPQESGTSLQMKAPAISAPASHQAWMGDPCWKYLPCLISPATAKSMT